MDDTKVFTVHFDPQLHNRLKVTAAKRDQPMSEIVREAVREWLDRHEDESAGNKEPRQRAA